MQNHCKGALKFFLNLNFEKDFSFLLICLPSLQHYVPAGFFDKTLLLIIQNINVLVYKELKLTIFLNRF